MQYLGLDLGSTSIKGGVLDLPSRQVHSVESRPFPSPAVGLPPLWFEVDPDRIVHEAWNVVDRLLTTCSDPRGVVVCSQMGGVILTDVALRPVTQYLSWRDQRLQDTLPSGRTQFDELSERMGPADLARVGRELKPGSAVCLLSWMASSGQLPADALFAMGLGEFVVSRLCDQPPRVEPTSALGTLDLETRQWHAPLFDRLGFGRLRWPELIDVFTPAGVLRTPRGEIRCFPAVGDHQAALLGTELDAGELSINISTGSQVSLSTDSLTLGDYQTRPYFLNRWLNTITHLPAGRSLNTLVDLLTELPRRAGLTVDAPWDLIADCVHEVPTTDIVADLAFFASSVGDRGHFENLRLDNLTVGHLFRAAFRNIADNSLAAARRVCPAQDWKQVVLSGGLPQRLRALRDEIINRFNAPVRLVDAAEETLQGLLTLARTIETRGYS